MSQNEEVRISWGFGLGENWGKPRWVDFSCIGFTKKRERISRHFPRCGSLLIGFGLSSGHSSLASKSLSLVKPNKQNVMKKYSLFPIAAALVALASASSAHLVSADSVILHQWTFDELETSIRNTANTGSAAVEGVPTWSNLINSDAGTRWTTTEEGGAMRISANHSNPNTLVQSVVSMPDLNAGTIRFEWDVSWTLTGSPLVIRETYLINRNEAGANRFRWTLSNPSGGTEPLMRFNMDGSGFFAINNVSFENDALILDGVEGNLVLRADFTFGIVNGQNGVTALAAAYSYNGAEFSDINLGGFIPYQIANLNDLRLHSKGALSESEFLTFNSVTVAVLDAGEPPPPPVEIVLPDLGLPVHAWRFDETAGTNITETGNSGIGAENGLPTFAAESNYFVGQDFRTDGAGSVVINGWNTFGNIVATRASMGPEITGEAWFRWDIEWSYQGIPANQRRVFMNHRPAGSTTAADNIIRFSLENSDATTVTLGMSSNVVAENTDVLGKNLGMSGSLSMVAAVFWNEQGEIYEIKAGYSEDGVEFFEIPLPEFAPFGANPLTSTSVENLGDILFNANGDYTGENYFRLKSLVVYLPAGQAEGGYAGWRGEQEFATFEEGAPMADPDGDGLINLVEYALGLNPLSPNRAGLPAGVVESIGDDNYLTLSVARNPAASDVGFIVEVSADLINWDSGSDHTTTLENSPALLRVRDNIPLMQADRRFIRLRIDPAE